MSKPFCYAAALGNCSGGFNREHFVSNGVLEHLATDDVNNKVYVSGLPWQKGEGKWLPPNNNTLAPEILCTHHNRELSPLDAMGKKMMECFSDMDAFFKNPAETGKTQVHRFNGNDLERYLLKELCGMVASGNAMFRDTPMQGIPPLPFLQVLFGIETLPETWGLYLRSGIGDRIMANKGRAFAPITPDGKRITGCIANIHDIEFLLALTQFDPKNPGELLEKSIFRPAGFHFSNKEAKKVFQFIFEWNEVGSDKIIMIEYHNSPPPPFSQSANHISLESWPKPNFSQ